MSLVLGMVGCLTVILALAIGAAGGYAAGRKKGQEWIREHGCYVCKEKLLYDETGDE